MNNDDFLLDFFQKKQEEEPSYENQNDSFLALSDTEIGGVVNLMTPVSASTTVEQALYIERHKLKIRLD